jgi:ornithine cyclodeaminase/alanine dehydrogenase-like protein (mu-crystallin family)
MGDGKVDLRPRQRVRVPGAGLNVMAAAWPDRGYFGFKFYSYSAKGIRFWVHLFDARSGNLVATMQANRLGQRRTGAASGIATKHLARRDASTVGIFGTGWQAESQLEATCAVRNVRKIRCTSRTATSRAAFAEKMTKILGVDVEPADSGPAVARDADIVITSTTSSEPVLQGDWLARGSHVNAMGANRPDAREIDDATIRRSNVVAVDSIEQGKLEAGDLIIPVSRSLLRWEWIHELAEIVTGRFGGRQATEDITLFKSLGVAIEDVAVAAFVYEKSRKTGVGKEIEF